MGETGSSFRVHGKAREGRQWGSVRCRKDREGKTVGKRKAQGGQSASL